MITLFREIHPTELDGAFLWDFDSYQCYHRMWEKQNDQWALKRTRVVRQWSDEKKLRITAYLSSLLSAGSCVLGAFVEERLGGFLALDKTPGGDRGQYRNLLLLFVDAGYRRLGIGKNLFIECVKKASAMGAEKLFISSIPAVETVAFYLAVGCEDAREIPSEWVDMPYDRYLEFTLQKETRKKE